MLYADVIVDISNENLDKTYQYIIPDELEDKASAGVPVIIPFGRGNREIKGYIIGLSSKASFDLSLLKKIIRIDDKELAIEDQMISLAIWMKEHYGATLNEALRTVIPVKKKVKEATKRTVVLSEDKELVKQVLLEAEARKTYAARARLLHELREVEALDYDLIVQKMNISKAVIESLKKKGVITIESQRIYRNPIKYGAVDSSRKTLNSEQQYIADSILSEYFEGIRRNYLIHGVTGSGKTEVYLEVIDGVISLGRQAIVLIPEIALTYQTVKRFHERFGGRISILNSKMSQGERYDQSQRAKNGEIDIMIGPRSALFTPFKNLGLIIIDEEHENSYKSEMPPKYHARETAVERAERAGASVILGSATPSLEAYRGSINGSYKLFEIKNRANDAKPPSVEIIDLREELKSGNKTIFSRKLAGYIQDRLDKKEQVMLFLNRRGYAGFISCRSCGQAIKCTHCDISLTLHNKKQLICHYCGYERAMPDVCPACSSKYIAPFGIGTQKVEEQIKMLFPSAAVLRMDADTTKNKDGHEKILAEFAEQEADILIGTQMIVKGHDFQSVTLVGILAADLSLYSSDYRASERTFQLLAQAAGRAGRGSRAGHVVIQTYQPEHYSIIAAAKEDYIEFYSQEILYRNLMDYPPAAHILVILLGSKNENKADETAVLVKICITEYLEIMKLDEETSVIGPAPCSVSKINDVYRRVIYVKQKKYNVLSGVKAHLESLIIKENLTAGCGIQFDFDPLNVY